ncbi:HAD family hydrolase [Rubrivivax gelatinosus]|uniref:Haloacid dehalogenase n=1 Tax=Rubrivivax gelatinosus TaxID=28068 RepID=A0ABS1DUX7_RUBGE|nr:HAD family phosphatase [Rubrivivax gelatinosus]MBK1713802.1 haloacid dehalogenase [Rubrivivax gelatinosus]
MARPAALLFDLDGTLIDSMPIHHEAWRRWHAELGLPFDDGGFFVATAGRVNDEILRELFPAMPDAERARLAERKEALYREAAAGTLALVPGARELLVAARAAGFKLAVCTASPLANVQVAFERFALDSLVDTLTSPADGLRGKPHPDIFLEAARRLGVAADDCLVFEDAPLGVEAAGRAGMDAVALTTTLPASAFAGYPNLRAAIPDFAGFDPTTLTPRETRHA